VTPSNVRKAHVGERLELAGLSRFDSIIRATQSSQEAAGAALAGSDGV